MANLGLYLQGSAIKIQAQFRNVTPKNLFLVGTVSPSRPETTSRNAPRATSEHVSLLWRGVFTSKNARDKWQNPSKPLAESHDRHFPSRAFAKHVN